MLSSVTLDIMLNGVQFHGVAFDPGWSAVYRFLDLGKRMTTQLVGNVYLSFSGGNSSKISA